MKQGARALGVAESYRGDTSVLAGAVVRASRVVDGFAFSSCTVGGSDATAAVCDLLATVDRADLRYLLLAGVAPAWYNILDLSAIRAAADCPVVAVSFEDSEGLAAALRGEFDGERLADRLEAYRALPERHPVELNGTERYFRALGLGGGEARDVLRAFTPEGGRPEPLRVARLAARAADDWS